MGRAGAALLYLSPAEEPYADFLRVRRVPAAPAPPLPLPAEWAGGGADAGGETNASSDANANAAGGARLALDALRREAEGDRLVAEAGARAFVSYVRAYKEHHCRFIFRIEDVPLGWLAASFALLRLPGMPEVRRALRRAGQLGDGGLKGGKGKGGGKGGAGARGGSAPPALEGFAPSVVDLADVPFRDRVRERQRQAALRARAAAPAPAAEKTAPAPRRRPAPAPAPAPGARLPAAKRRQLEGRQELDELAEEYALLRKLKKGKISAREFDAATGLSDDEGGGAGGEGGGGAGGAAAGAAGGVAGAGGDLVAAALKRKARRRRRFAAAGAAGR
jgi:ATP-dependent RNA helicase DDX55/SPB4